MTSKADKEILALLNQDDNIEEQDVNDKIPVKIPITKGVMEKAFTVCDLVRDYVGSPSEWVSFLLASKSDPDYVVRDLLLINGAEIGHGHVEFSGQDHAKAAEEVKKINKEINKDYYIIGWLHSHADFGPFHSKTDSDNFENLLNTVRLNTEQKVPKLFNLIESEITEEIKDGFVVVSGEDIEDAVIKYAIPNNANFYQLLRKYGLKNKTKIALDKDKFILDLVKTLNMKTEESVIAGFGYSIVVNDKRANPYAEIGVVNEKIMSAPGKRQNNFHKTSVDIFEIENDIIIDESELEKSIKERFVLHIPKFTKIKRFFGKGSRRKYGEEEDIADWDSSVSQYQPVVNPISQNPNSHQYPTGFVRPTYLPNGMVTYNNIPNPGWQHQEFLKHYNIPSSSESNISNTNTRFCKIDDNEVSLEDMVKLFVSSVSNYLIMYKCKDVKYSYYMDSIFQAIDNYGGGLTNSIRARGNLKQDDSYVNRPKYADIWGLGAIANKIYSASTIIENPYELEFMSAFANAKLKENLNLSIEKYIPIILNPKIIEDDGDEE